jgi:hypothetical protein
VYVVLCLEVGATIDKTLINVIKHRVNQKVITRYGIKKERQGG